MIMATIAPDNINAECKLFRHLPGVYYTLRYSDLHWSVTNITHQTANLFGYTEQEVYDIASTFLQTIILPEDFQMVRDRKKEAFVSENLFDLEFRIKTKNGEIKYVRDQYIVYAEGDDWAWRVTYPKLSRVNSGIGCFNSCDRTERLWMSI